MNKKSLYGLLLLILVGSTIYFYYENYASSQTVQNASENDTASQASINNESSFLGSVIGQVGTKNMDGVAAVQFKVTVVNDHIFQNKGSASGMVVVSVAATSSAHLLKPQNGGIFDTTYDSKNNWYILKSYKSVNLDF